MKIIDYLALWDLAFNLNRDENNGIHLYETLVDLRDIKSQACKTSS